MATHGTSATSPRLGMDTCLALLLPRRHYLHFHGYLRQTSPVLHLKSTTKSLSIISLLLVLRLPVPRCAHLQRVAGLVHADERVLQGLKAGGGGDVPGAVAAVDVQQSVVTLFHVLHQLQHLLGVLRCRARLVEFLQQTGPVLNEVVDVLLVDNAQLLSATTVVVVGSTRNAVQANHTSSNAGAKRRIDRREGAKRGCGGWGWRFLVFKAL